MPTRRTALLALGAAPLAATSSLAAAQGRLLDDTRPYRFPFSEVLPLRGRNGVDYEIYVRVPPDHATSGERYPLILVLDADYSFVLASNIIEHLADRMSQGPRAIVAAIAYRGAYPDRHRYRLERTRDYTPIRFPTGGYGPVYQAHSGGGPRFLETIERDVLPMLDRHVRTISGERTLVGHSYGGLFAGWVLQQRPDLFNRYLIVSPSLWYADRLILAHEERLRAARLPRRTMVYLAVGSWEEQPQNGGHMVTELERFAGQLTARGDPNLIVKHRVFEDETHASIFPAALSTGIRHLFQMMAGQPETGG